MSDQTNVNPTDVNKNYDEELAQPPSDQTAERVDPASLKQEAAERAKQRPLIQKILSLFQKKEKGAFRELIINSKPLEKRVALLVDGILDKFEIERESDDRMVGGIFKGRVKNLDPGLKAAFVDIGFTKNAFLHYWDILPAAADSSVEVVRVNRSSKQSDKAKVTLKDIPASIRPAPRSSCRSPRAPSAPRARAPRPTSPCPAASSC